MNREAKKNVSVFVIQNHTFRVHVVRYDPARISIYLSLVHNCVAS
ncbi:hypothetical protein MIJ3_00297 [Pseudomonas phage vB_PaeM_MIJ3]|nr:hypothetical protein MIJ3_00297 [Pseudomonas phage vB_PaeM_MIJ3]